MPDLELHEMNDSKPTVLVVDDEPLNLELIVQYLENSGVISVCVDGGEKAWDLLQKYPARYSAVLLDRMMPGMDGMELLARIKSDAALAVLPVIMQTAEIEKQSILEGLQAGAHYYLTKPYDGQTLLAIVNTAVSDYARYTALQANARKSAHTLKMMAKGRFVFKSLEDARDLAALLANACTDSDRIVLGLTELMINAVEHGNLGISYEEKSRLNNTGDWEYEVKRRLDLPENKDKHGFVEFERNTSKIVFNIIDQGSGFDWRPYLELSPERALESHGRGIALAKSISFDRIEYCGNGNEVRLVVLSQKKQ